MDTELNGVYSVDLAHLEKFYKPSTDVSQKNNKSQDI